MKAVIDQDKCIGCGLCPQIAPEVYEMKGDKAVTILDEIPEDKAEAAQNGADQCPVAAIEIVK
ncbi:MAG: ferredoxin [Candidatus Omnitrophica bacterium]|nr:ferredoxin [Candidatus Omnitrophota bacterium]